MTLLLMNRNNDNPNDFSGGTFLSPESIALTSEQVDWAMNLSQAPTEDQSEDSQWQVYLSALALQGVQQWFQRRSPHLPLRSVGLDGSNRLNLSQINAQALDCLEVGDFKLRLMILADPGETEISVPKALIDRPQEDFYVWVEVLEESAQVRVCGYLRCDQVRQQSSALEADAETYWLPLERFDANPEQLLLYLQLLDASAFALQPAVQPASAPTIAQRAINAGLWLSNQVDQVAQELAWIVLPPEPNWAMRSSQSRRSSLDSLDAVVAELIARRQIQIPPQIGHAYQEVRLGETDLRLYAVVWELAADVPNWMLLLILMTPTGSSLPPEVKLRVRDETQLLADRFPERSRDSYVYAQVQGGQEEKFYVSLSLDAVEMTLPAFEFNLNV